MSNFFLVKIKYLAITETGKQKFVTKSIVFPAESYTEAEVRATRYADNWALCDYTIKSVKPFKVVDILTIDSDIPLWYMAKIETTTLNERTGKEEHASFNILTEATCFDNAIETTAKYIADSVMDMRVLAIMQTDISDVALSDEYKP